ncbi:Protein of unknown function [Bacillus cytotoxicus]|nr:Protein of unknown function [Bacillus cytotoxicus]
MSTVTNHVLS